MKAQRYPRKTHMKTAFSQELITPILQNLHHSNAAFRQDYPGDFAERQPVHTVYGGAHIFKADTVRKLGAIALDTLKEYAPSASILAKALPLKGSAGEHRVLYERMVKKLRTEPVEDYRIDFEDGYGVRPDAEEDYHAGFAAEEAARGMAEKTLPPFLGVRIKPFTEDLKARSIRTLDIFVSTLLERSGGKMPANFVVTLPKVTIPEHVAALADILGILESEHNLAAGSLRLEIMIETPQSIISNQGVCPLPSLVDAGRGRCVAAHFGPYDYAALLNIAGANQTIDHPACDFARHMMKAALAGSGIRLSDGPTNVLPIGPHREAKQGKPLTAKQKKENRDVVYHAWQVGYKHITNSLKNGFYQSWDLHPAQLPIRYAAVYSFFREELESTAFRLRTFVGKAAQATLIGDIMDDAATGQGLLNFFLRGITCGALTQEEALTTGLTMDEIRSRSFVEILRKRKT